MEMQQEIINGFRLSPQQGRLWTLQQESQVYRAQCALLIEGDLEIEVLRDALHQVIRRYEILRTTFHSLPGMKIPVQVIAADGALSWNRFDLSDRSPEEQNARIEELFREDLGDPSDFARGPLLRAFLLSLSGERHVLFLSLPSLCADARTLRNLAREIGLSYEACVKGEGASDEPMQYAQFSEWQHELLEDEDAEAGREFWRKQIQPAFKLPFEIERAGKTGYEPAVVALAIDRAVAAKIEAAAEKQGVSTAVFLQACWQTLLWRLAGQADIVIGSAFDGRQHEVLQSALGLFAKWTPVHCRFEETLRFNEVLSQVAASLRTASEWQDYFVWDEGLVTNGNGSQAHFFSAGFEFEELLAPLRAGGVSFSIHKQQSYTERFHLKLSCCRMGEGRTGEGMTAELHYHSKRFHPEDVKRLAGHFDRLLRSIIEEIDAPVARLNILGEAERRQLLSELNQTAAEYSKEICIHQLFEEQVRRAPGNLAVVFKEQQLSYAALNAKANQLAAHLRKLGVGPDAVVGLCLERSPEMVVAILGILKAGAAYLFLEPTYPKDRLAFMLADAQAPVLITQERVKEHLPEQNAKIIAIDADWETIAKESEENPACETTSANLAYVIYTSGSTGRPKGVMIAHRSVINLANGLHRTVYADQHAPLRVSLNAPLTFDASVKQLVQLLYGHTLCILPEEVRPEGNELLSFVSRTGLDVLDCTPAQLQLMLAAGLTQGAVAIPKLMLIGGEAIDDAAWMTLSRSDRTTPYNVYGPTECTVDATVCSLRAAPEPAIGRPIANTKIFLLDKHFDPVPFGIPGELFIGGDGLARGYLGRADVTAERFVPNPYSEEPGARLYRTGDLARYLPDGNLKFLGRVDHQVKLRGFRIELGEIEAVLKQHPSVQESVVVVREDTPGDQRMVAYVVVARESESAVNELRPFLRETLPEYMVPSAFVRLKDLPLTRHGKVDRRALPAPESERPELHAAYVAPKTKIEQKVAAIWQEVLRVEKVGINDNFFDLGGHSLLMVQVHSRLRDAFNKEISLIEMFRNPTVSALTKYFADEQRPEPSLQKAHSRVEKRRKARNQQTTPAMEKR